MIKLCAENCCEISKFKSGQAYTVSLVQISKLRNQKPDIKHWLEILSHAKNLSDDLAWSWIKLNVSLILLQPEVGLKTDDGSVFPILWSSSMPKIARKYQALKFKLTLLA